jgi:outer membrane receptor protein involved in Fe transport
LPAFAGQVGKLAGKVIDAATKEPIIGANVVIAGTKSGGSTDAEGNYYILNIPPGMYDIKASAIGYSSQTIKSVRISVDQTTKIDFFIGEKAVEISDVIISAVRPIVQKDLTSTENKVSGDDISMLPLEDVNAVVNLQAGVVNGHFRGGRSNEVKYLIDGVAVNDAFSGESTLQAEVNSIQELQVLTGTFNAEYGEAMSGIVNQVTKVAGDKLKAGVSLYTGDYFTKRSDLFQNIGKISPKDIYNIQADLSGPLPFTKDIMKFFISGRYFNDKGYIYGKRMFNPSDSSNFDDNDRKKWYVGATGDGQYVPMANTEKISLQGKLSFAVGGGKGIVFNGLYQENNYRDYNHSFSLNPNGDYQKHQKSYLMSGNYTHVFSSSAFLDLSGSAFISKYNQYVYEDPLDVRYQSPNKQKQVSGNSFLTAGTENWHFDRTTTTLTGKADFTYQATSVHQLKTGIEYNYHTLDYQDYETMVEPANGYKPQLPLPGAFNYNVYKSHPFQIAAYLQDKIELEYLVINVGLRFDYFEPDGKYLKDPNKISDLDGFVPPFPDSLMNRAKAKYQFSPRIGISYPITDKGAIHLSYGHFFQVPPFEYLYKNPNFRIPVQGSYPNEIGSTIGNTDLKPQQTVMYEIGLQQEITPMIGFTLSTYYKDIRNLLGTEIYLKDNTKKFSRLVNKDYGSVWGVTVSFEKRLDNMIGASLDYTYQVAKGSASDPNDSYEKSQANIEINKQLVPLNWDRRHSLNFTITLGEPGDFIASFIGRLGSGLPYTPSLQNQRTGLENSDNRPAMVNVDFYITKYLHLLGSDISAFIKIYNIFDTANENEVFGDTGRAGYTLELTQAQSLPRGVNTLQEYFIRPDYYSAPRQIIIGAQISL